MFNACLQLLFYPSILFGLGVIFLIGGYFSEYLKDFRGQKIFSRNLNLAGLCWLICAFVGKSFEIIVLQAGEDTIQYFERVKAIMPLIVTEPTEFAKFNTFLPMVSLAAKNIIRDCIALFGFLLAGVPLIIALACTVAAVIFGSAILIVFIIKNSKPTV